MGDLRRTRSPRRRPVLDARRAAALTVSCGLLMSACGGSSGGLGDANGGVGVAGRDGLTADTESAADGAGPLADDRDERSSGASAEGTTTTAPPVEDDRLGSSVNGQDRPQEEGDERAGVTKALAAGSVPGLASDDPFQTTLAAYWTLLHQARHEPWTYDEAQLDAVAVGAGRDRFLQRVDNLGAAESVVAPTDSWFEVRLSGMRIGRDVAVGEECVLDDLVHVVVGDVHTGERYDPPLVTDDRIFTNRYGVTFQLVGGVWKIADRVLIEDGEGVSGCARDW